MADSQDKTVDGFVTVTIPLLSMGMQDCVLVGTTPLFTSAVEAQELLLATSSSDNSTTYFLLLLSGKYDAEHNALLRIH